MKAGRGFDIIWERRAGLLSTFGLESMSTLSIDCQHYVYGHITKLHKITLCTTSTEKPQEDY